MASYSSARSVSATLRKAVSTTERYCASVCSSAAWAAFFLAHNAPPWRTVCSTLAPTFEPVRPGPNNWPKASDVVLTPALSVICGNWLAMATPTWALAECRAASEARTSGRCSTSLEVGEFEPLDHPIARQAAGERGQQIALLRQHLFERWQRGLGLGERGLLRGDVGAGDGAQALLLPQDAERLALGGDDALGGVDLGTQRRLQDGGGDDVGSKRQVGRLELEALRLG